MIQMQKVKSTKVEKLSLKRKFNLVINLENKVKLGKISRVLAKLHIN